MVILSMNKLVKLILISAFVLSLNSCKRMEDVLVEYSGGLVLDSVSVVKSPQVKIQMTPINNGFLLTNAAKFPYQDSTEYVKYRFYGKNLETITSLQFNVVNSISTLNGQVIDDILIPATVNQVILIDKNGGSKFVNLKMISFKYPNPSFTKLAVSINPPFAIAPLTRLLKYEADQEISFKYSVLGQDGEDFVKTSTGVTKLGEENVFGLYPDYANQIKCTITNTEGNSRDSIIVVKTVKLPDGVPEASDIKLNIATSKSAKTNFILSFPFKTLNGTFNGPAKTSFPVIIDKYGKIRGFLEIPFVQDMKLMPNGHYLLYRNDDDSFSEFDLMGKFYHGMKPEHTNHHDFELLPNGNIIYTGEDFNINATIEDKIYEVDYQSGRIINELNLYDLLDPSRQQLPFANDNDWLHMNSLAYDRSDNTVIFTARGQSLTAKVDMAKKKVVWMISDPTHWVAPWAAYLLKPSSTNFNYSYGLHSVRINPSNHNAMLVFDNGNARSYTNPMSLADSYSRMVEYTVNPATGQVAQTFEFGKNMGNYCFAISSVDYVTPDDLFVNFGWNIKNQNGNNAFLGGISSARFMEVDRSGKVNLDIVMKNSDIRFPLNGFRSYRARPFTFFP
jgi:arylsulfate sulfotransferase